MTGRRRDGPELADGPELPGILSRAEVVATAESVAEVQLRDGMIPWFPGGHADPWNHVEAAMALAAAGLVTQAEAAYGWLAATQHADGSWCNYYLAGGIEDPRLDTNVCAYVAVGTWYHYLVTGDCGFLQAMWPVVEAAVAWVLSHQREGGEVTWAVEPDGTPGEFALLTGSSSIYTSLRCALAGAGRLGLERPDWELAAGRLAHAVARRPEAFAPKDRWAMDWYYPVLSGALTGEEARARLAGRWSEMVMDGVGVRCVSDRPWVTAAETAECAMALDAVGGREDAALLLEWAQGLRHHDGSYWTGWVQPGGVHFPGGERTTYTAAAVILAVNALGGTGPAAGVFRGEGLPAGLDLADLASAEGGAAVPGA
ncbi:MAG: prenyltransferase [Acidimicrobiales bacterium]